MAVYDEDGLCASISWFVLPVDRPCRTAADAMTRDATRRWYLVHKWTSIVVTAFLLMLCLTGLPLIFYEEIDEVTRAPQMAEQVVTRPVQPLPQTFRAVSASSKAESASDARQSSSWAAGFWR